ncbi:MAG: hypothetical protein RSA66_05790 [Muribaculaceae bacterium]
MRVAIKYAIIIFLLFNITSICNAEALYLNAFNGYGQFGKHSITNQYNSIKIADDALLHENSSSNDTVNTYKIDLIDTNFTFEIRLANLHNDEGKTYKVIDRKSHKKLSINNPTWGVVWNYIDKNNYNKLVLQGNNTNLHDIFDKRTINLSVITIKDGAEHLILSKEIDDNINLYKGYNVVVIKHELASTIIKIGNKTLRTVGVITDNELNTICNNASIGYFVGAGAKVAIDRVFIETNKRPDSILHTKWTIEKLDAHFANTNDLYEGYWEYLDRNLDENKLRIGGRYRIALVKTATGYDIIYADGAKVNESNWSEGMLKGAIKATTFIDNYDLIWYDAMMLPFNVDVFAKITNNSILELHFPLQNSTLRFAKQINENK